MHRVYEYGVSRSMMRRIADELPDAFLDDLAHSDVLWDEVVAIEPRGEAAVFDATVPGTHNFVANDVVVHNSIEQDADVVAVHLPRRVLQPGLRPARHGRDHRRQAPQRPHRHFASRVPRAVHEVRQPRPRVARGRARKPGTGVVRFGLLGVECPGHACSVSCGSRWRRPDDATGRARGPVHGPPLEAGGLDTVSGRR